MESQLVIISTELFTRNNKILDNGNEPFPKVKALPLNTSSQVKKIEFHVKKNAMESSMWVMTPYFQETCSSLISKKEEKLQFKTGLSI